MQTLATLRLDEGTAQCKIGKCDTIKLAVHRARLNNGTFIAKYSPIKQEQFTIAEGKGEREGLLFLDTQRKHAVFEWTGEEGVGGCLGQLD